MNSNIPENKDHVLSVPCLSPMLTSRVFWTYWIETLYVSLLYFKFYFLCQNSCTEHLNLKKKKTGKKGKGMKKLDRCKEKELINN